VQKFPAFQALWIGEKHCAFPLLDDAPLAHENDPPAQTLRLGQVVGDTQYRQGPGQGRQRLFDELFGARIQRCR